MFPNEYLPVYNGRKLETRKKSSALIVFMRTLIATEEAVIKIHFHLGAGHGKEVEIQWLFLEVQTNTKDKNDSLYNFDSVKLACLMNS